MALPIVFIESESGKKRSIQGRSIHFVPCYDRLEKILNRPTSESNEWAAIEVIEELRGPLPLSIWRKVEKHGYHGLREGMLEAELDQPWIGISKEDKIADLMLCTCNSPDETFECCRPCARAQRFKTPCIQRRVHPHNKQMMRFCFRLGQCTRRVPATLRREIEAWLIINEHLIEPAEFEGYVAMLKECGY